MIGTDLKNQYGEKVPKPNPRLNRRKRIVRIKFAHWIEAVNGRIGAQEILPAVPNLRAVLVAKVTVISPVLWMDRDGRNGNRMDAVIRITVEDVWGAIRRIDREQVVLISPVFKVGRIEAVADQWRVQCRLKPISKIPKKRLKVKRPIHARIKKASSLKRNCFSKRKRLKKR